MIRIYPSETFRTIKQTKTAPEEAPLLREYQERTVLCLFTVSKELQQEHEHVDEVQVQA